MDTQMTFPVIDLGEGITIAYDTIGDPNDQPVLLMHGMGQQLISWPKDFCQQLADQGFYVIRFDSRDAGQSYKSDAPVPTLKQLALRKFDIAQYRVEDMADDAIRLIEGLDLGRVHLMGWSLGGMVGQTIASQRPELVRSLTSFASGSGNVITMAGPPRNLITILTPAKGKGRDAMVEKTTKVWSLIGSDERYFEPQLQRDEAGLLYDRGLRVPHLLRQMSAALNSGDRIKAIKRIQVPTQIIHGTADGIIAARDAKRVAKKIKNSQLTIIEGMGHDLPTKLWPQIIGLFVANAARQKPEKKKRLLRSR